MRFRFIFIVAVICYISSCSNDNRTAQYSPFIFASDTISPRLRHAESLFTIPSPMQTLILLKESNSHLPEQLMIRPSSIYEGANTSARKALLTGMLGADLSLLNLYKQKELAYKDVGILAKLFNDLELDQIIDISVLKRLERNYSHNDSVLHVLSDIYTDGDQYLKDNDRRDICAMIVAGGWIESFYCLTQLYSETKNQELFELITYQGEVLDNLIRILSPFYEKSSEYSSLIDKLVNLAYEFDVLDYKPSVKTITTDSVKRLTVIHNRMNIQMTGSKMNRLALYASNLRNTILR